MPETATDTSGPLLGHRPSAEQVVQALETASDIDVVVFPRADGNYPGVTPDFVALLREAGVKVAYATDPASARSWEHKGALDQMLPAILISIGDVRTALSTIDGIVFVVSTLLGKWGPRARLRLDAGRVTAPDGAKVEWVALEATGDPDSNAQMVRDSLRRLFED